MFSDALGTLVIMRMCPPNTGAGVGSSGQRVLKKPPSSALRSNGIKKKKISLNLHSDTCDAWELTTHDSGQPG